jgi:hypothetical protein
MNFQFIILIIKIFLKSGPEEKHLDILLIDKFERFEQLPAGFKLIADSGLYDELSVPFEESVKSFKS